MISESQKRATKKYNETHYKRVPLNVNFDEYDRIKKNAEALHMSVNGFIKDTLRDRMDEIERFTESLNRLNQ